MELEEQYKKLLESLELLAASFDEQKNLLPKFVDVPDDVVSTFEDSFLLLPQLIEAGRFSNNQIASILRLYNRLECCGRDIGIDDFSNAEWDIIRGLSKQTLQVIINGSKT